MKKDMTAEEYLQKILTTQVSDTCPMRKTLELLSGKWRTHIIYELCKKESCRFGELKKAVPKITNTMLSSTLKDLEKFGIIHREQFNEIPPHVEYSLTDLKRPDKTTGCKMPGLIRLFCIFGQLCRTSVPAFQKPICRFILKTFQQIAF